MDATADISPLVKLAKDGLLEGNDLHLRSLLDELSEDRRVWVISMSRRLKSISTDDLFQLYQETVWELVISNGSEIEDFLTYLGAALRNKAFSRARKEVPYAQKTLLMGLGDERVGEPTARKSAEDEYFEQDSREALLDIAAFETLTDVEKAIVRNRIEHGTSLEEISSLLPHLFANKQQVWRRTVEKFKKARRA